MSDFAVVILSGLYVAAEALLAWAGFRFFSWKSESVRKCIHILTSFLILPVVFVIRGPLWKMAGPLSFILINFTASSLGLGRMIGMETEKRRAGLVVYPFSVSLLVYLSIRGAISDSSAAASVLAMGLGDGMAALIGRKWGRVRYRIMGQEKSVEGSIAMVVFSLLPFLLLTPLSPAAALLAAALVTAVENISPSGLDNLSVPLSAAFLLEALCRV